MILPHFLFRERFEKFYFMHNLQVCFRTKPIDSRRFGRFAILQCGILGGVQGNEGSFPRAKTAPGFGRRSLKNSRGWSAARRITQIRTLRRGHPWRRARAPRRTIGGFSVPGAVLPGAERSALHAPDPGGFRRPSFPPRPAIEGSRS